MEALDLIDRKILCELDINCRNPASRIGKKLRISRNVVKYRIKNLEKRGIIQKYICSINLGLLGYKTYKIFFKTQNSEVKSEKDFADYLAKNKNVIHLLKTEGAFDYSSTIAVKKISELDDFLMELKNEFRELIKDYSVNIVIYSKIFKLSKLLLEEKRELVKFERYSADEKKIQIDEKDILIIKELSENANMPIIDIAAKTKLSLDVVKYRLKNISQNLVSSYRIMFDFNKIGYYHYVIMLKIKHASKTEEENFISWCALKKNILFITKRIGYSDFEVNAAIKDIGDLNEFIAELKKNFSNIIDSYELLLNSKLIKLNYVPL